MRVGVKMACRGIGSVSKVSTGMVFVEICCEANRPQLNKQRTEKVIILMKAITCYGTDR